MEESPAAHRFSGNGEDVGFNTLIGEQRKIRPDPKLGARLIKAGDKKGYIHESMPPLSYHKDGRGRVTIHITVHRSGEVNTEHP